MRRNMYLSIGNIVSLWWKVVNVGYGARKHVDDKIMIVFKRRGVRYGQFA